MLSFWTWAPVSHQDPSDTDPEVLAAAGCPQCVHVYWVYWPSFRCHFQFVLLHAVACCCMFRNVSDRVWQTNMLYPFVSRAEICICICIPKLWVSFKVESPSSHSLQWGTLRKCGNSRTVLICCSHSHRVIQWSMRLLRTRNDIYLGSQCFHLWLRFFLKMKFLSLGEAGAAVVMDGAARRNSQTNEKSVTKLYRKICYKEFAQSMWRNE